MKKIIVAIFLILFFSEIYASESNFRNSDWGMSIKEVKENEVKIEKTDIKNTYESTDYLFDNEFIVNFIFENNKLIKGSYLLMFESNNINSKFSLLNNLYKSLNKKYGDNNIKNVDFELFLLDRKKIIIKGYCDFECKWEYDNTNIILEYIYVQDSGYLQINYNYIIRSPIEKESEEQIVMAIGFKNKDGFRNSKWGMKINEVKKLESLKLHLESKKILSYNCILLGMPCKIMYSFDANRLRYGFYFFNPNISSSSSIINDFLQLKKKLISQYGLPKEDNSENINNFSNKTKYELSVLVDESDFRCVWIDNNCEIQLRLSEDSDIDFSIILSYTNLLHTKESYEDLKNKL